MFILKTPDKPSLAANMLIPTVTSTLCDSPILAHKALSCVTPQLAAMASFAVATVIGSAAVNLKSA